MAMEGLANGAMCITSGAGGLKDFILESNKPKPLASKRLRLDPI